MWLRRVAIGWNEFGKVCEVSMNGMSELESVFVGWQWSVWCCEVCEPEMYSDWRWMVCVV